MATSSREARRRRIVDRGSDRLDLITGKIRNLPSSSSEPNHFHNASCPPSISHDYDLPPLHSSDLLAVSPDSEDKYPTSLFPKHESAPEMDNIDPTRGGIGTQAVLRKCETNVETVRAPYLKTNGGSQSSRVSSAVQSLSTPTSGIDNRFGQWVHCGKIFTPSQINSAVAASESMRICCSMAMAILAILSHIGFRVVGGHVIKRVVFFRPLYLVLVTNISVVLSRLLLENQRGRGRTEQVQNPAPAMGEYGLAEQIGKTLELGLVLQNIMGAVFMDCSVYAIIVVCGLSIAQAVGW